MDQAKILEYSTIVKRVHTEHEQAHLTFDESMASAGGTVHVREACKTLLLKLDAIDVAQCPNDYREKFDEYLCQLQEVCQTMDTHPTEQPDSPKEQVAGIESQQRLLDGIEKMNQSGKQLRRIAAEYGATIGH